MQDTKGSLFSLLNVFTSYITEIIDPFLNSKTAFWVWNWACFQQRLITSLENKTSNHEGLEIISFCFCRLFGNTERWVTLIGRSKFVPLCFFECKKYDFCMCLANPGMYSISCKVNMYSDTFYSYNSDNKLSMAVNRVIDSNFTTQQNLGFFEICLQFPN